MQFSRLTSSNLLKFCSYVVLALCAINLSHAQFTAFNSAPTYSLTFDSAPSTAYPGYEWQNGRWPNLGLAYFNGMSHFVTLGNLSDVAGRAFPNVGGAFTIELWVSFENWAHMSHIFDVSNNNDRQNVFLSNIDTGNGIRFGTIVKLSDGTEQERLIDRPNLLSSGVFSHVVATMALVSPTDTTSNTASLISLYVNGRLVGNATQYVMPAVARTIQYLGKSTWAGDGLFTGWIDTFNYYNYPLSDQAVFAHAVLQRAPAFELTFGQDPRVIAGSSSTFGFVLSDPADVTANVSQWHQGVVTLNGNDQYIDLTTNSGSSSVGTSLPTIGGAGYGTTTGSFAQGWTFEVAFRTSTINSNSKIFDLSNNGNDRIYLGFESGTALYFRIQRGSATSSSTSVISSVSTNTWYHVVVAVLPISISAGTAEFRVYVNGISVANTTGAYPDSVSRPNSYIGRSVVSTESYCTLTFDALRIHDYAVTPLQARLLYYTVSQPTPVDPIPPPTIPSSAPRHTFNFDEQHQQTGYSSYSYIDHNDGHFGVAAFNGINSSVNLAYYPDSKGETFIPVWGGEFTISCWIKYVGVAMNSRIVDFGGYLGIDDNNILFANSGASTELFLRVFSGATSTSVYAPRAIRPGNWQHVVASVARNTTNATDTTSTYAGILRLYVDGKLVSSRPGFLPPRVYRRNLLVGRSNWIADARFQGYIDSLQFYEYALDSQQIASFACTKRPPVFDFSFTRDPRTIDPSITYNYGWLATDPEILLPNTPLNPTSENVTFLHQGMLSFSGASQYVNLTATSGPTNIGIQLPVIGGPGSGVDDSVGWSFEISFKVNAFANWAKVFDWGVNANGDDDILFGSVGTSRVMGFEILNSRTARSNRVTVIDNAVEGRWYHAVIIVTPINITAGIAAWSVYLDAESLQGTTNGVWPDAIMRKNANIGRSNWNDAYFNGVLDSIRVYDYALTENDVRCLYRASRSAPEVVNPPALFTPGPRTSYSFDSGYDAAQSAVANYDWVSSLDGHNGVASFNGVNSFINMLGYTDSRQRSFPNIMGGTDLTFAGWIRFNSFASYSRVFDIGNGAGQNNICLMNRGTSASLGFHVYSAYGVTSFDPTLSWPSNQWVHVVITMTRNPNVAAVSANDAGVYSVYFNATQVTTGTGVYTSNEERLFAYLGKSGWSADAPFNGAIDSWAWWDYSLSYESILTLSHLSKPPYIELTFAADPRKPEISSTFLYNWLNRDSSDPIDSKHQGIIDLDGPSNYYVDLMRTRGNRSIGINMPQIGGLSSGSQSLGTNGWTFEIVFKYDNLTNYCKILNLGNGANQAGILGDDNVIFGLRGSTSLFTFEVMNSRTVEQSIMNIIPDITLGRWYTVVVVVEPTDMTNFKARYTAYIDGVVSSTIVNAAYFQGIYRENAFMGKSEWTGDALCDAKVDLLRIYDYALSAPEIAYLATRTVDAYVPTSTGTSGPVTSSSAGTQPSTSSTGTSTTKVLNCGYSASNAPANSPLMTMNFYSTNIEDFPNDFGMHFGRAVSSVLTSSSNEQVIGCYAVKKAGITYNANYNPADAQVEFVVLNSNNRASSFITTLISSQTQLQSALNTHLGTKPNGSPFTYDPTSLTVISTMNADDDKSSSLSGGAIAGIVIGVIFGVILLIALAFCFVRGRGSKSGYGFEKKEANQKYDSHVDETNDHHEEEGHENDTTEDEVEMQNV